MNNFKEVFIKSLIHRMPIGKACILFGNKSSSPYPPTKINTWDQLELNKITWDHLENNLITWEGLENNEQKPIIINTWEELNLNKVSYDYLSENSITYEELEKGIGI